MSGHTPGPWLVDAGRALRVANERDETVATTGCDVDHRSEWEANARLIASAPELLAALKGLIESLPDNWGDKVIDGVLTLHVGVDDVDDALAAIAKAEGR